MKALVFNFSLVIFSFSQEPIIPCKNLPNNFTGACESYFENGQLGAKCFYDSGSPVIIHSFYSNGNKFFVMDKSKESEFTLLKEGYYPNGALEYRIEIVNGNGVVEGFSQGGNKLFFGAIENKMLIYPWVSYGDNNDTVSTIQYNQFIENPTAFNDQVRNGFSAMHVYQERPQGSIKEFPLEFIGELEETPSSPEFKEEEFDSELVRNPDIDAQFPGGEAAMKEWIFNNLNYPELAKDNNDMGWVFIVFIVDKTGKISNPTVLRSVTNELDLEAIRLINAMPDWIPAQLNGENVTTQARVGIMFRIN